MNRSADVARSFCLVPVKRGDPFSCVHPTSINSLGREALEKEEREDKSRESASRPLVFWLLGRGGRTTRETRKASGGGLVASQTAERRKLTTNMPD